MKQKNCNVYCRKKGVPDARGRGTEHVQELAIVKYSSLSIQFSIYLLLNSIIFVIEDEGNDFNQLMKTKTAGHL